MELKYQPRYLASLSSIIPFLIFEETNNHIHSDAPEGGA